MKTLAPDPHPEGKYLFRYVDPPYSEGSEPYLETFKILRTTEKGAWIEDPDSRESPPRGKFCLSGEGKRFAHTSKQLALDSYYFRKKRQVKILAASLSKALRRLNQQELERDVEFTEVKISGLSKLFQI